MRAAGAGGVQSSPSNRNRPDKRSGRFSARTNMALPKQNRLKGKREFTKIFTEARPAVSRNFFLRVSRGPSGNTSKFAVVVPAKLVALATARNLLRRRTSEVIARVIRASSVGPGISAVVSVRTKRLPDAAALEYELLSLMKKSGILN